MLQTSNKCMLQTSNKCMLETKKQLDFTVKTKANQEMVGLN